MTFTIWPFTPVESGATSSAWSPWYINSSDATPTGGVTLASKFKSSAAGTVSAIRFLRPEVDGGTRYVALFAEDETVLASKTVIVSETVGWNVQDFDDPVAIEADTWYYAAYFTPLPGHYAATLNYFATSFQVPYFTVPNGAYKYGTGIEFPDEGVLTYNTWVGVVFEPNPEGTSLIFVPVE